MWKIIVILLVMEGKPSESFRSNPSTLTKQFSEWHCFSYRFSLIIAIVLTLPDV
jgi:hypothetical protein